MGETVACIQRWEDLAFLHWRYPEEAVRAVVPEPLTIDVFDGSAWVGIVAFEIRAARPPILPPAAGLEFPETNVRTYVRGEGCEPGVAFLSLDAASRAMVAGGRLRYGLPYHRAEMRVERVRDERIYESARSGVPSVGMRARVGVGGAIGPGAPGTLDHFLIERYALHASGRGGIRTVRVRHEPYFLRAVERLEIEESLLGAVGLPAPGRPPDRARFAERVEAEIVDPGRGARR